MSFDTIIMQLGEFLSISIPCSMAVTALLFVLFKYIFKKEIHFWKLIPGFFFVLNVMFIIYLTFLTRSETYGQIDLHLFRSYHEAWNTFSVRNWQLVIFNIVVFLPLGLLAPILFKKMRKFYQTVGTGFLFSLFIEVTQRITHRGLCELDDLFNNTLGVLLGYCIFSFFYSIVQEHKHKLIRMAVSILPILLTITTFTGIFYRYNHQEYGNLPVNYTYRTNLSKSKIVVADSVKFDKKATSAPIFVPKGCTREEAKIFASKLLDQMGISGSSRYSNYDDSVVCYRGAHNVTVYLEDQSYEYHYIHDDESQWGNMGTRNLMDRLELYGIEIPENAIFGHPSEGCYQWTIERTIDSVGKISGTLSCITTTDGKIYSITNQMVKQSVYKNEEIISETEAYQKLVDGYFQIDHNYKIHTLVIKGISLTYSPDTKGYYQPVYLFNCEINGENRDLVVAALK